MPISEFVRDLLFDAIWMAMKTIPYLSLAIGWEVKVANYLVINRFRDEASSSHNILRECLCSNHNRHLTLSKSTDRTHFLSSLLISEISHVMPKTKNTKTKMDTNIYAADDVSSILLALLNVIMRIKCVFMMISCFEFFFPFAFFSCLRVELPGLMRWVCV